MLSEWQAKKIEKLASAVCSNRNHNRSFEAGKSGYEIFDYGVIFYAAEFRLDSSHADYIRLVAKIVLSDDKWELLTAQLDRHNVFESWLEYPTQHDFKLHELMNEIEKDPHTLMW